MNQRRAAIAASAAIFLGLAARSSPAYDPDGVERGRTAAEARPAKTKPAKKAAPAAKATPSAAPAAKAPAHAASPAKSSDTMAPFGRQAGIFPFPIHQKTLQNGLKVVVIPTPNPGILSYYTVVRTGSRNEVEPGHSGFAHFFEHMMFRGTEKHTAEDFNNVLKRLGADSNAYTSDDLTVYHATAAASALETLMELESDRFQHLKYDKPAFQKESRAVLGEYNKGASSPFQIMEEKLMDTAFTAHTYKHTTIGFLKDIEDMPNQYEYSLGFFDRYYRPEYCNVLVVGDVKPDLVFEMAERYYGGWKRGAYVPEVPVEPPQSGERTVSVKWSSPTLPYLWMGYKAPAFDTRKKDTPALDLLGQLAFSATSPLYQKLVVEEQSVDLLQGSYSDHRDPHLFGIIARVKSKDPAAFAKVKSQIEAAIEELRSKPVDAKRLGDVKSALKYGVAMRLDTTDGVAGTITHFLNLTGDPGSIDELYRTYDALAPADLQEVARRVFVETGRTVLTLTEEAQK